MSTTLTHNLQLRVNSNLTADAKYNLAKLDSLGGALQLSTTQSVILRSVGDIIIEPQSLDLGGSGVSGAVSIGTADHAIGTFTVYGTTINLRTTLGLLDQTATGTKYLRLSYDSTGPDLVADRTLHLNVSGADRTFRIATNASLIGPGSLSLTSPANLSWVLPSTTGTLGQVLSNNGAETLSWTSVGIGTTRGQGYNWVTADGTTKLITHTLTSTDVDITVQDAATGDIIFIDSILATSSSTVLLTASEVPTSTWRVLVQAG